MDLLSDDILLHISKFLCNNTCCTLSELHKLALTNKYYFNIYKEKITIIPLIPSDHIHKIYKNIVTSLRFNCYLCGPFNKTEIINLVDSIKNAIRIKSDSPRDRNFYPKNSRSNTIHFHTTYEIEILKAKTERLTHDLNFLIAGRCCSGKGSTLYIKH
jgi:hypothetical protein